MLGQGAVDGRDSNLMCSLTMRSMNCFRSVTHLDLSNLSSFYDKFFTALDDRGLQPSGDIFEELTVSSIVERNEDAHITKLMVAVL